MLFRKMSNFEYDCSLENLSVSAADIESLLPDWKTKVTEIFFFKENDVFEVRLFIAATTIAEVKEWVKEFEFKNKFTYSVRSTPNCTGSKILFKQRLNCHHNTSSKDVHNASPNKRTRNTNCPSYIIITLHAPKKRYQGKNKTLMSNPGMLCEIRLVPVHNHNDIRGVDALRFRKVSEETAEKILELYKRGHTPATALQTLKIDIQLNYEHYENVLADRYYCPDYMYCYNLYVKYVAKCDPLQSAREFLTQKIIDYNERNPLTAGIDFEGEEYAICICTALMKRVHSNVKAASQLVLLDATGTWTIDNESNRVFTLFVRSECGDLPLAIFITSSDSTDIIIKAFNLLKELLGNKVFGGKTKGPDVFLTDDSASAQAAVKKVWPNSVPLLHTFNVLQTIWRWLIDAKNCVPCKKQQLFFQKFRAILHAQTTEECREEYQSALESAKQFPEFTNYLEEYWERRQEWALSYRTYKDNTNSIANATTHLVKDRMLEGIKSFNLVQLIDFMYNTFALYYEQRLLDVAHNRGRPNIFENKLPHPPVQLANKIRNLYDEIYGVPSDSISNLVYLVNMDIVSCSCSSGRSGEICKHIEWTYSLFYKKKFECLIDNVTRRGAFYFIATGRKAPAALKSAKQTSLQVDHIEPQINTFSNKIKKEQSLSEGQELIEQICLRLTRFLKSSPNKVKIGLEIFNTHFQEINNVGEFASCCSAFASEYQRRDVRSKIKRKSVIVRPCKTNIKRSRCHLGGRPRKKIKIEKSMLDI